MADRDPIDRLLGQLMTSGLQIKDNPLFQVISQLIKFLRTLQVNTAASITIINNGVGAAANLTYITVNDETALLAFSRRLVAGTNITLDVSTPGQIVVNGGAGGITELTGDVTAGPGSGSQVATIANNAVTTVKVLNDAITYAKIQNISASDRLLGRDTAGSGDIEEIPVSSGLEFTGGPGLRVTESVRTQQIGITVDGGGVPFALGPKGFKSFMVNGTIIRWRLMADQPGDVTFDIFKDAYVSYPSTTSIIASAPPTMTGIATAEDTTLTGWDTTVNAGDVFAFEVTAAASLTRVTLELTIRINN